MQLGMVGLGRMSGNSARRLMRDGHWCVAHEESADAVAALAGQGAAAVRSLDDLVAGLDVPRAVWLMLSASEVTENAVRELKGALRSGGIVIDGGNAFYKGDIRRTRELKTDGIDYVDVGGGVWEFERGYCLEAKGA